MKYSLGILYALLVACLLSVCDIPITISFENPFFSSPYAQVLQQTMQMWSDIRLATDLHKDPYHHDEYVMYAYAILGQLLCIDDALDTCDATELIPDDLAYLARIVAQVKQEAMLLSFMPAQTVLMERLFKKIEKKIEELLSDTQNIG